MKLGHMNTDFSNHGPIDRDAQRLSQELDGVRARSDRPIASPSALRHPLLARVRTAVNAVREVFDGIAEANERFDRINRPWIYEGVAWVDGAHGAVRMTRHMSGEVEARRPRSDVREGSTRSSDAPRAGLRPAH